MIPNGLDVIIDSNAIVSFTTIGKDFVRIAEAVCKSNHINYAFRLDLKFVPKI